MRRHQRSRGASDAVAEPDERHQSYRGGSAEAETSWYVFLVLLIPPLLNEKPLPFFSTEPFLRHESNQNSDNRSCLVVAYRVPDDINAVRLFIALTPGSLSRGAPTGNRRNRTRSRKEACGRAKGVLRRGPFTELITLDPDTVLIPGSSPVMDH